MLKDCKSFFVICLLISLTSTSNTTIKSSKKGLGFGHNFMCGDVETFSNLNWYYNWGGKFHPECGNQPSPGVFVPMIWGYNGKIQDIGADPYDTILGFNEPNHESQSNLSPEEAAFAWIELQEKYPDKILVSPSASGAQSNNTFQWFREFFDLCEELGCRVDYIATHSYCNNVDTVMDALQNLYESFGRKIWLTEFARSNTKNPETVLAYMKEILPRLEAADFVSKYAWYEARYRSDKIYGTGDFYIDKVNSLLEVDAETPIFTELGKYYDDYQPDN